MLYPATIKTRAVNLRTEGLSYKEIHSILHVPKTTLSDWLHSIELTEEQLKRIKGLGGYGQPYAAEANRKIRLERTLEIFNKAKDDIQEISSKELWYMGIMLYWAEGHKQKPHNPSTGLIFNNSDPSMVKMYLNWTMRCLHIESDRIDFSIYIHKSYGKNRANLIDYWSHITGFPEGKFDKVYYKNNKVRSYRKNRGENYFGVLRIAVKRSTDLNRQITGWIQGICEHCGVV